jgi:hypothetical protein
VKTRGSFLKVRFGVKGNHWLSMLNVDMVIFPSR